MAWGVGPAAALALIALWEIAVSARAGADVPGSAGWAQAARVVRDQHRAGDLIVFAPRWIDPVGRQHLGDLIPIEVAGRMDADRFGTLWEVSIRGARAPETRGLAPSFDGTFGGVRVRRYTQEPARVLTDFVAALRTARVEGDRAGGPSVELEEVGFAPRRCVRVEPRPDGTVRILFPGARLGEVRVGHVGLADVFTRRDIREPGRLEVLVNGETVADVSVGVDDGWVRFAAETTPSEAAEVTFLVTAVGARARHRLVCFAAEARQ
jgi:hypothetical protein